ncbi:ComEC/Rec2 family competence protein [Tessaracoccus terricola]
MTADGHDLRLLPLAAAAWAGAWVGTGGFRPEASVLFSVFASLGIAAVVAARARRHWAFLFVLVLTSTALLSGMRELQLHESLPAQLAAEGRSVQVRVRLVGDARLVSQGTRPPLVVAGAQLLRLESSETVVETAQEVVVFAAGDVGRELVRIAPGSVVELRASLATAEPASPEAAIVRAREVVDVLEDPGPVDTLVNLLRAGLQRAAAAHSPPEQAALVPSLVVGDTSGITEPMTEDFKATSLSHLLAVSGANLTLMLSVVLAVARAVGVRGRAVRIIAVACVVLFVLVCRSEPSVVRAAAMGLVSLSAIGLGRGRRSMRHLGLAVLCLMLLDPWLARSWGFALSVSACCGISLLAPVWTRNMAWLPRPVAEALTIPLAAQVATQPLITALSGQVSVVGVLANMVAGPFVGPATTLGLAATALVWFPPAAAALAWLAGWCVQPILWTAEIGASLPAASLAWPADVLGVALCVVGCVLVAILAGELLRTPLGVLGLVAVMVLGSFVRPVPLGWPGPWSVVFCDVGQGDATVLRAAPGAAVVVDTGSDPGALLACLDSLAVTAVPLLVLTHYHSDHVGGAAELLERYEPDQVVVSPLASPEVQAAAVARAATDVGASVVVAVPGQVFRVGEVTWTTVGAFEPRRVVSDGVGESGDENDSSVVGLAEVAGLRVLLPGDVEPAGQRRAVAEADRLGLSLDAHVLKLPHHGSSRQEEAFFLATGASLAVASAGRDNDYGHPSDTALELAMRSGMQVARTDTDGAISVTLEDGSLGLRRTGVVGGPA